MRIFVRPRPPLWQLPKNGASQWLSKTGTKNLTVPVKANSVSSCGDNFRAPGTVTARDAFIVKQVCLHKGGEMRNALRRLAIGAVGAGMAAAMAAGPAAMAADAAVSAHSTAAAEIKAALIWPVGHTGDTGLRVNAVHM